MQLKLCEICYTNISVLFIFLMKNIRIYISDIHMNDERSLLYPDSLNHYGWLNQAGIKSFSLFLQFIADSDDIDELVLLGDILDSWICPIHLQPQTFDDILSAPSNGEIIRQFNRIISHKKKLIYVPGNHDMLVTNAILQKYIPGIIFTEGQNFKYRFHDGNIYAEHGNTFAMFNAPDQENGINDPLPVGYYISRILACRKRNTTESTQALQQRIEQIVKNDSPELIIKNIIDSILQYYEVSEMQPIVLPNDKTITAYEIKKRYSNLYNQWIKRYGKEVALQAAMADLDYLEDSAIHFMQNELPGIFILGHSHIGMLKKISFPRNNLVYANTGTWCEYPLKPYSFIETERDKEGNRQWVRLMNWVDNREARLVKEEILDFV